MRSHRATSKFHMPPMQTADKSSHNTATRCDWPQSWSWSYPFAGAREHCNPSLAAEILFLLPLRYLAIVVRGVIAAVTVGGIRILGLPILRLGRAVSSTSTHAFLLRFSSCRGGYSLPVLVVSRCASWKVKQEKGRNRKHKPRWRRSMAVAAAILPSGRP